MKATTLGAALLGLLFVGCAATQPQDPLREAPESIAAKYRDPDVPVFVVPARQDPPTYRDVLRGKVGQECEVRHQDGVWTLLFGAPGEAATKRQELPGQIAAVEERLKQAQSADEKTELMGELLLLNAWQSDLTRGVRGSGNLAAVGQDFVQLREADGTERYVPLSRVHVVVRQAGR